MSDGKFRISHINHIQFSKAQRGWLCEMSFRVQTRQQFTMEHRSVEGYGRKGWLGVAGVISAAVAALRAVYADVKSVQSQSGEWNLDGTVARN